jgi:hypothetical protein
LLKPHRSGSLGRIEGYAISAAIGLRDNLDRGWKAKEFVYAEYWEPIYADTHDDKYRTLYIMINIIDMIDDKILR